MPFWEIIYTNLDLNQDTFSRITEFSNWLLRSMPTNQVLHSDDLHESALFIHFCHHVIYLDKSQGVNQESKKFLGDWSERKKF
jgi:hypothetical protein